MRDARRRALGGTHGARRNPRAVIADGAEMEASGFNHGWLYARLRRVTAVAPAGTVKKWRGGIGMPSPMREIGTPSAARLALSAHWHLMRCVPPGCP